MLRSTPAQGRLPHNDPMPELHSQKPSRRDASTEIHVRRHERRFFAHPLSMPRSRMAGFDLGRPCRHPPALRNRKLRVAIDYPRNSTADWISSSQVIQAFEIWSLADDATSYRRAQKVLRRERKLVLQDLDPATISLQGRDTRFYFS